MIGLVMARLKITGQARITAQIMATGRTATIMAVTATVLILSPIAVPHMVKEP